MIESVGTQYSPREPMTLDHDSSSLIIKEMLGGTSGEESDETFSVGDKEAIVNKLYSM